MIYLQEGNFPLNEAFSSEIVQEANSTYQLTFKFPTSDPKWALLIPETELVADDLHGEQYFTIFEVEKQHGYVTVYANQVATLLNGYSINKINVDRVNGATVMNALVAGFKRETPFTFFSDVMSKHTLNLKDISAMEALAKDKHSIVGQWGGDLVRDKYSVRLLEHGGIENESLFAYKKNMKSFQETKSTKELRTRIHFKKVIEAHEEGKKDQILTVTIDSPLINKYKHIYEADMEVQDQDVVDQKTLEEYGKRYFRETLCDMIEESLEIDVVGQADQPVHMFDFVSIFHEGYDVDLRKKIMKYKFNPMSIKLVSIGFGEVTRTLADSISGMVNDSVDKKMKSYDAEYEAKVQKLVDNANAEYDKQAKELEHKITDGIEQAKAQAEVVKQEISAQVTQKIAAANQANKNEIVEEFKAQYNGIEVKMQGLKTTTDQLKTSDADIQKLINDFKAQTQSQFVGIQGAQSRFEQTTEKAISDLTNVTTGKADRSYVEQTVNGIKEEFTTIGVSGGPNMLRNSRADEGLKYWTETNGKMSFTAHTFYFNGQKRMFSLRPGAIVQSPHFIVKRNADYMLNMLGFDANSKSFKVYFCKRKKGSTADFEGKQLIFEKNGSPIFDSSMAVKKSFKFNVGDFDDGYLQFEYVGNDNGRWAGLFMTELDFYEGTNDRKWQPAPEDQNYLVEQAQATFEKTVEGLSTQLTKLETKTGPSGELEQRMLTYSEKAAVDALKATRQILEQGYVAKSQYTEDVAGITRRFDEIVQAGENLLRNSGNPQNVEGWGYYNPGLNPAVTVSTNPIYYNESRKLFKLDNSTDNGKVAASQRFNIKRNTTYTISFDAIDSENLKSATFYFLARKKGETGTFSKVITLADKIAVAQDRITRYYFTVNSEDYDEAFLRFDNNGSSNGQTASLYFGDIDVYEGSIKRAYQPPTDDGSSAIETKLAEYKQTVDGQFTTITNQMGDMLRKTDIQITPGQISFGVGKEISGRTISSLLVQEPESIALIAKLIKVKGDMVVDGSILGRHIASESVETGHMKAGSVTTPILASNAVTADKLQVDYALIQKLLANQAFIRELTSQKAFITQLASIDISAEHVKGGRLSANTGSTVFDLDNGTLNLYSNTGTIRRIDDTNSSQFIKLTKSGFVAEQFRDTNAALMILGTNHNKDPKEVERHDNDTFAGIRIWSGKGNGTEESLTEFIGDRVLIYNNGPNRSPWNFHNNINGKQTYLIPMNQNNVKHYIGRGDFFLEGVYSKDFFMAGGVSIGKYLWDLITCFGQMVKYSEFKSKDVERHIRGVVNGHGFR
ncbi:MAG: phage tail protein [Streptococcus parasanguinis]|uniref:Phage tail protein n=2 Tax=Streptococcus TaxID=1301 RepID=A0A943DEM9_STRPA|nr:phage tail protein [Streptococcus parasanguinis]